MPQHIPQFGFEIAPEISAAEREAVSTRPDSSLQRAIRATQQSEEFFTPGQLLMSGPRAFRIAREAEKERRDMLVSRAQQGINLSNIAISHRGTQRGHDARRREEEILSGFIDRTRGMDDGEAMSSMTPEEVSSPLTMDFLRQRDQLDVLRSNRPERELKRRQTRAMLDTVSEEDMRKEISLQRTSRLKKMEGDLQTLVDSDYSNLNNYIESISGFGEEIAVGIHERIQADPEGSREIIRFMRGVTGALAEAEGILGPDATNAATEALGAHFGGWARREEEIDARAMIRMLKEVRPVRDRMRAMEAEKVQAETRRTIAYSKLALAKASGQQVGMTPDKWIARNGSLLSQLAQSMKNEKVKETIPRSDVSDLKGKALEKRKKELRSQGYVFDGENYVREVANPFWQKRSETLKRLIEDLEKREPGKEMTPEDRKRIDEVVPDPEDLPGAPVTSPPVAPTSNPQGKLDEIDVPMGATFGG